MDLEKEKPSVVQNVDGEHNKVVGGNTFYGDAHIHIHGDMKMGKTLESNADETKTRQEIVRERKKKVSATEKKSKSKCAGTIALSATGAAPRWWPGLLGRYEATGRKHEGAAVYSDGDGGYLSRHSDGTWHASNVGIGGTGAIRSVDTADCPASIRQWQYDAGYGSLQSGAITAQCSVHT